MIRSFGLMNMDNALSTVVLPELVPPETIILAGFTPRPSTQSHKNDAISLFNVLYFIRSTMVKGSFLNLRMVIVGPLAESGAIVAFTRDPLANLASKIGDCWSILLLVSRAIESIMFVIFSSLSKYKSVSIIPYSL